MPCLGHEKITAFFVFPFSVVVLVISAVGLLAWSRPRWIGLAIAIPAAALLFTARWQLGKSCSVTLQARALVTHGVYSKIYVFGGLMLFGFLVRCSIAMGSSCAW